MFNKIDKDKNQLISKEELRKAFIESGITISDKEFANLFLSLDVNKSGYIDYTEFLAGAIDISLITNESNLRAAFKFFDKDNSGEIDKDEIRKAIKTGWISELQVSKLFDAIDKNCDQKV